MESPDQSKVLTDRHWQIFQFSKKLYMPQKKKKKNYGAFSITPVLRQLFERLLSKQLAEYLERILSKCQCGFVLVKTMVGNIIYK